MNAELLAMGRGSLFEALSRVEDPRKRRGVRHQFTYLLALTTCAVLSGCKSLVAIGEWAKAQSATFLRSLGATRDTAPDESTIRRNLANADPKKLEAVLSVWMAHMAQSEQGLAIDGKTERGARDADGLAPHLVSLVTHNLGIVLAQCRVAEKSNEIKAVEPLLKELDIQGAVVTGDAMFAQKEIARYLVEKKRRLPHHRERQSTDPQSRHSSASA